MRVMWITAMPMTGILGGVDGKSKVGGGWISTMLEELCRSTAIEEIVVVAVGKAASRLVRPGKIKYVVLQSSGGIFKYDSGLHSKITEVVREFKPDIIDVQGVEFYLCRSVLMSDICVPIVATLQGLTCEIHKHYFSGIQIVDLLRNRTIRDYLLFDGVIERKYSYKRRGKNELDAFRKLKYVLGRTGWDRAVSTSINPQIKHFTCARILRNEFYDACWQITGVQRHSIFMAQAHYPIKGLHLLLESLSMLIQDFPDLRLYVAGKDMLRQESIVERFSFSGYQRYLASLIKRFNLGGNIVFTGSLPVGDMVNKLLKTHVFVLPSTIENSPNALAEAQLVGVPSVAALVGGVADYVHDGVTGMLYNSSEPIMLADKIRRIFVDDQLAKGLSLNGRKTALLRHDKLASCVQLIDSYKEIICLERGDNITRVDGS